jgi:hypothetical protein
MKIRGLARILPSLVLTTLLCTLAVAATTSPLSRARLGLRPQFNELNPRLDRNTYFEVSTAGAQAQVIHACAARNDLPFIALAQVQSFELPSAREYDASPSVFSGLYRRVLPLKSGDSDPGA